MRRNVFRKSFFPATRGYLIKEKAALFLDHIYPEHDVFEFSFGWLEIFKDRHAVNSFRRFRMSWSVDMTLIE